MRERSKSDVTWSEALDQGFLAEIIDLVAHPIFVKDRGSRFVVLNRAFCEMTGYRRDEMLGKTDHDFFPKSEADFFRQKDVEMFETGRQVVIEEEPITDASGVRHVLATTKVPLFGASGEVTHLVGIIHDITRLKAAEDALRFANEELERRVRERTMALEAAQSELVRKERLAVLGQLAGGLAHQIRNPLGTIANATSILKNLLRTSGVENVTRAIGIIDEETWEANRIITDLLDFARVRPPRTAAIDVPELLETVLRSQGVPSNVEVVIDAADLPEASIDVDQVRDALENLVRNALEAMPDGGRLTLEARRHEDGVAVRVSDTGGGIPPEVQARLFEPLVTSKPTGMGLGLPTAKALIENQRGTLRSCPSERGACFEILLPTARPR